MRVPGTPHMDEDRVARSLFGFTGFTEAQPQVKPDLEVNRQQVGGVKEASGAHETHHRALWAPLSHLHI